MTLKAKKPGEERAGSPRHARSWMGSVKPTGDKTGHSGQAGRGVHTLGPEGLGGMGWGSLG